ncbi:23S rRNA (guanosine(2251)-2'-O)-methyltransferase RlmB [Spiribacter roseus]|uniref:23S rRNA (guanosine(2251)-2'-O)-methyltransferase RlmB n=1 Tax=Spiribacter roseus TaxID=1855875 RepID=UPI000F706F8E|nr:23S rRNA (guanosine(2251)-2'-O)-methyltransferase RlmB [Spiribacter roseus]
MSQTTLIGGLHSVQAALRYDPSRVREVWLDSRRRDGRHQKLRRQLEALECPVHVSHPRALDEKLPDFNHQGVIVAWQGRPPLDEGGLAQHLDGLAHEPLILVLDQVQDPHNLGACLRSADAAGVDAVITPRDRAAGLTPVVHRVAAGAAEAVPLYQVTNLVRCLRDLRDRGIWLFGLADTGAIGLHDSDLGGAVAVVMGAEGTGLRRLTREHCDALVAIPMAGRVESLNVSVATGVVLFEAVRQRSALS